MENDLKGIENYFELTGSSSYRRLPEVDCSFSKKITNLRPELVFFIIH